jgi:hypothetical protein
MRERLGIEVSREEMQTTFEDFRVFIGSPTGFEAAHELLSAPKGKVKTIVRLRIVPHKIFTSVGRGDMRRYED